MMKRILTYAGSILAGIAVTIFFIGILGSIIYAGDITWGIKASLGIPLFGAILVTAYSVYYNWNLLWSGKNSADDDQITDHNEVNDIDTAQLNSPVQSKREDFI